MTLQSSSSVGRSATAAAAARLCRRYSSLLLLLTLRNSSRKQHTVGVRVFTRRCVSREHDVILCVSALSCSFKFSSFLTLCVCVCVCIVLVGCLLTQGNSHPTLAKQTKRAQGEEEEGEKRVSPSSLLGRRQTDRRHLLVLLFFPFIPEFNTTNGETEPREKKTAQPTTLTKSVWEIFIVVSCELIQTLFWGCEITRVPYRRFEPNKKNISSSLLFNLRRFLLLFLFSPLPFGWTRAGAFFSVSFAFLFYV